MRSKIPKLPPTSDRRGGKHKRDHIPPHLLELEAELRAERCPETGRARCGAPNPRRDKCCRNWCGVGKRCRNHGGNSLKGPAHPGWKGGKRSDYLPQRLQGAYERSMEDKELISLRHQLAVLDARETELEGNLTDREAGVLFKQLDTSWEELERVLQGGYSDRPLADLLHEHRDLIEEGVADSLVWDEIYKLFELRRRLADSERRRIEGIGAMMSAEAVLSLCARIITIVAEFVPERTSRSMMVERIRGLLTVGEVPRHPAIRANDPILEGEFTEVQAIKAELRDK